MNTQPVASAAPRDEATLRYFDTHTPEYDVSRLGRAADAIARRADESSSLIDLGCGAGNTLRFLMERTGIREIAGVDVSPRYLVLTHEEVGCPVYEGSVLDEAFVTGIGRRYDFAVVAAVLHHLIGRTRSASRARAELAISNALRLLRPGGFLVVVEPVWYPSLAMDGLFYVKKALTAVTSERVSILGEWNNIGPPVVSSLHDRGAVRHARPRRSAGARREARRRARAGAGAATLPAARGDDPGRGGDLVDRDG